MAKAAVKKQVTKAMEPPLHRARIRRKKVAISAKVALSAVRRLNWIHSVPEKEKIWEIIQSEGVKLDLNEFSGQSVKLVQALLSEEGQKPRVKHLTRLEKNSILMQMRAFLRAFEEAKRANLIKPNFKE